MKIGHTRLLRSRTIRRAVAFSSLIAITGALTLSLNAGEEPQQGGTLMTREYSIMGPPKPPRLNRWEINESVRVWPAPQGIRDFYTSYTGSPDITTAILDLALELDLPVNLAFSLAWAESRYNPEAVSKPNPHGTRDWGLFQLNDGGRPEWSRQDFFDVEKNAHSGLTFLRHCVDEMGSVEQGLAAYNAGVYGVRQWGVPESTRHHLAAIVAYERVLDRAFSFRFPRMDS